MEYLCKRCGTKKVSPSYVKRVFCSNRCKWVYFSENIPMSRKGTTNSEGMKIKISESLKRYYKTHRKIVSPETRLKMSNLLLANPRRYWLGKKRPEQSLAQLGEKNRMWKGGITEENRRIRNSPEYKNWRRQVRERDLVCVICGSDERLQADHIKSSSYFPELRYDIANGRLLCMPCHIKTDNYGGRARSIKRSVE